MKKTHYIPVHSLQSRKMQDGNPNGTKYWVITLAVATILYFLTNLK